MTLRTTSKGMMLAAAGVFVGTAGFGTAGFAQEDYPSRTVEVIHQHGPGGGTDRFIRAIAKPFEEITGESMVPIAIQGGQGMPALINFLDRPADGHTILAISPNRLIQDVRGQMDMDDLMPVSRVQYDQALIWVPADSQFETAEDLISYAKENPGDVTIGVTDAAGFDTLAVSMFANATGTELTTVPFGASEMAANTVGGQIDAMYEEYASARGLQESGDLRALVLFSEERLPSLPDVPTAQEIGYDVTAGRWRAFALPADTDPAIAEQLHEIVAQAVESESYQKFEQQSALQHRSKLLGPEEFQAFIDKEMKAYEEIMRELGLVE